MPRLADRRRQGPRGARGAAGARDGGLVGQVDRPAARDPPAVGEPRCLPIAHHDDPVLARRGRDGAAVAAHGHADARDRPATDDLAAAAVPDRPAVPGEDRHRPVVRHQGLRRPAAERHGPARDLGPVAAQHGVGGAGRGAALALGPVVGGDVDAPGAVDRHAAADGRPAGPARRGGAVGPDHGDPPAPLVDGGDDEGAVRPEPFDRSPALEDDGPAARPWTRRGGWPARW